MAEQYWIGGFFIDLSRNQITQNDRAQTLAPKALAVLTCLAKNQGKVVSHETLLADVWQDTAVSPNTIQKSIAQLRKALGDDGKVQVYIKTHAKQGYSLECDVRWQEYMVEARPDSNENKSDHGRVRKTHEEQEAPVEAKTTELGLMPLLIAIGVIVSGVIGYMFFPSKVAPSITIETITALTATDDKEFDGTYTPDGQYIVFHRYLEKQCVNRIWAKNIDTHEEILLTRDWGAYGSHSFSKDGKSLVFLATEACTDSVAQTSCYDLMRLDFQQALDSPREPTVIMQCKNTALKKPVWSNDGRILLMQNESNRWKLISYSPEEHKSTDLYVLKEGNIVNFTYSVEKDLIAVTRFHSDGRQYLDMLGTDGNLVSGHQIEIPREIPEYRPIFPRFTPLEKQLIFSTGRQLFTLSHEGRIAKISLPFADRMAQPEFHPDGKRLLMLKGPYDGDIVLQSFGQILEHTSQTQSGQPPTYTSFERSTLGEDMATFQPGGDLVAFWSERSGEEQLWLGDGNGAQQLTRFPLDTRIRGIDWAKDGQSLLVNANYVLTQVFLDSKAQTFSLEHPVVQLFQWDSRDNSALALMRINGLLKLVSCHLDNSEIRELTDKKVKWSLKTEDGRLIYKDHMDQFWQPGPAEDQRIQALDRQGGRANRFMMDGNVIYAINTENQLWSYDLDRDRFQILGAVSGDVDYLTDVYQEQVLMTVRVAAKKELVELHLKE